MCRHLPLRANIPCHRGRLGASSYTSGRLAVAAWHARSLSGDLLFCDSCVCCCFRIKDGFLRPARPARRGRPPSLSSQPGGAICGRGGEDQAVAIRPRASRQPPRRSRRGRERYGGKLLDETASILAGTRLAGHSYKRWVLEDYMALLRVRSLLARGRARHGPETTVVVARLFDTSTAAGVPKECFWLVVKYAWLGDWRRP